MKNKIYIFLVIFLKGITLFAQIPDWKWAKSSGGNKDEGPYSTAIDINGNIIMVGFFNSQAISFDLINLSKNKADSTDIFIAKYAPDGSIIWAKSFGGNRRDEAIAVVCDKIGNIYVTGFFESSTIVFDTLEIYKAIGSTPFIIKLNSEGTTIWAKSGYGNYSSSKRGYDITLDKQGNIIMAGYFAGSMSFDNKYINSYGLRTPFLVKYQPDGKQIWIRSGLIDGGDWELDDVREPINICTDNKSNIILTGYFENSFTVATYEFESAGKTDIYIAKYTAEGYPEWIKTIGGNLGDYPTSIKSDINGNIYIAGTFESEQINFDSLSLYNSGYFNIFLAKYRSNGKLIWAKKFGSDYSDFVKSLTLDSAANCYLTGTSHSRVIVFGKHKLLNAIFYVVKFDSTGNAIWAKKPTLGAGIPITISCDKLNNLIISGRLYDTLTLGSIVLKNPIKDGNSDIFITKLSHLDNGLIERPDKQFLINLFPNPANETINVSSVYTINEIIIYNLQGQIIYYSQPYQKEVSVNIDKAGIYFVRLYSEGQIFMKKIIIE